jgi:hypothetical protein
MLRRNARNLGDDVFDLELANGLLLLRLRQDALRRAGFVDDVDRLVGQVTVVDVLGGQFGRAGDRRRRILDAVVLLEARLEPRRMDTVSLTEGSLTSTFWKRRDKGVVLLEHAAEFGIGRCADALQCARRQGRLEQVGCVHGAARCGTGADQGMDLVDEKDGVRIVRQLLEDPLQALLEIAPIFGTGQQGAHVQAIHRGVGENLRNATLDNVARQAFGDRGFADASFSNQQ